MDFVTKKEFEAALIVVEKAIKGSQLQVVNVTSDIKIILEKISFTNELEYINVSSNSVTFVPATQAIKDILHSLRKEIQSLKDSNLEKIKLLEELEKREQKLITQLALSKE